MDVFLPSLLVLIYITVVLSDCNEASDWMREEVLDPNNKVIIKWKYDKENLTMMMIGETKGWVGVGFSPSGQMTGADIVIGWIKDGRPFIQDRYATRNGRPMIDDIQSYVLLGGNENSTHTSICWTRKFNTCEKQDYKITNDTVRMIYAFNPEDPVDMSLEAPQYHGINRGMTFLHLFSVPINKPSMKNVKTMDILAHNITLPNQTSTLYWCTRLILPKLDKKRYIIGSETQYLETSAHLIHHWAFYECSSEGHEELFNSIPEQGFNCQDTKMQSTYFRCNSIRGVFTVGNEDSFYPPDVGLEFGSTEKDTYYILETHYNLVDPKHFGITDSSGIRIYYTNKPPKYEGGIFNVGIDFFQLQILPPHQKAFHSYGICPPKCMQEVLPSEGIRAFSVFYHAHYTTRKIRLHRYRNGVELEPLVDEFFNADFQQRVNLKEEILILPNDTLVAECVYDTTNQTTTILNGPSASDEMCLVFLFYYPRVSVNWCLSSLRMEDAFNITGIQEVFENTTVIKEPTNIANISAQDYWKTFNWTDDKTAALQNVYLKGKHQAACRRFDGYVYNKKDDVVQIPQNIKPFQKVPDECS